MMGAKKRKPDESLELQEQLKKVRIDTNSSFNQGSNSHEATMHPSSMGVNHASSDLEEEVFESNGREEIVYRNNASLGQAVKERRRIRHDHEAQKNTDLYHDFNHKIGSLLLSRRLP